MEDAEVFAAHVGAAGVLSADAVGFSCRDLPEQTLRILTVDQKNLDQAQVDSLVEALAATPEGYGVILLYAAPEGLCEVPYAGTVLTDIVDAFMAEKAFSCQYGEIKVNADFTKLAKKVEFLAHLTLDNVSGIRPDTADVVAQAHASLNKGGVE